MLPLFKIKQFQIKSNINNNNIFMNKLFSNEKPIKNNNSSNNNNRERGIKMWISNIKNIVNLNNNNSKSKSFSSITNVLSEKEFVVNQKLHYSKICLDGRREMDKDYENDSEMVLDSYSISMSNGTSGVGDNSDLLCFPIQNLPEELVLVISNYFSIEMIYRLSLCSSKFYKMMQDLTIWKQMVLERWDVNNHHSILSKQQIRADQWKNYCQLKTLYCKRNVITSFYLRCKGSMPSPRYQHTGTVIGNSIFYIGGQETQIKRFNDIYRFDVDRHKFFKIDVQGPNQPPKFARHTAVPIRNRIFVFGGFDGSGVYFDLAIFDTEKYTWSLPTVSGTPPRSRTNHASAVVGKDLYVFGGINRDGRFELQDLDEFYVLDTQTFEWKEVQATGDIPSARCGHRLVSIGKNLYLFGGGSGDNWLNKMNEIYIFNTETGVWRKTPSNSMVQVCTFSCVFVMGPLIFVFSGQHLIRGKVTKKLYIFDTISESWIKQSFSKTLFPSPRDMATANVINNRVYIFGGYDGRAMDELNVLEFTPSLVQMLKCNYY
ncbi:hypothetical protein DLAC_02556 [Tieghemostelium lacteum]|uniref:F-box domain-containing protein n=1 Tax=Tieghemostelium lacteum TaxID=361077 RepID=A0A152A2R0_TIELA|nr:hypothetical protein DLAC_02556 [Tieghemostelium lacteum]|eukprot:KYR00543.1 hypothetical protein DLAC_02556 [Tieghemostelium lacteum]